MTSKQLKQPIVFVMAGMVVPKQRPRVEKGHARYAAGYENWRKSAKLELQVAVANMPASLTQYFPLTGVKFEIEFHNSLRTTADLDNSEGALYDAFVKADIIANDSVKQLNENNSKYFDDRDRPVSIITIYPNWQPVSTVDPRLLAAYKVKSEKSLKREPKSRLNRK